MAVHEIDTEDSGQFYRDLSREDSLTVTIKGAIYVEQQLDAILKGLSYDPVAFEKIDLTYLQRVQLAVAFGLPKRFLAPLKALGEIRNKFAHVIRDEISGPDMDAFYNTFDPDEKSLIQNTYAKIHKRKIDGKKRPKRLDRLDPIERFQLYVTTLRSALVVANREITSGGQTGTPR
ncbi:UNVERIFIED_ORG: hypothetical protein GGE64_003966 [Rhizobium etli]